MSDGGGFRLRILEIFRPADNNFQKKVCLRQCNSLHSFDKLINIKCLDKK
ncbi:Uncharacterized protein dnm_055400 [Desulfonema magnum]|uniref:Uncharacterized protein n=1 Tax=Desulfonema magnum TaxID=45655 RepID=A0A975BQT0_9BACT|nr:Uncharacterized protein dnm_055400 [Desulfonema magnum]